MKLRIARVDALGREGQQEIFVELQAGLFKHRQQNFVGRAGIGCRLENDQLTASQPLLDLFGGRQDVGNVRLFCFAQRRRDADDDRIALAEMIEVGRGPQALAFATISLNRVDGTSPMYEWPWLI